MKKILFLHGFFASGQCVPAQAIKEALKGDTEVLTPDLPLHPTEALQLIRDLCEQERPQLLVGNSCGAFLAQIVASRIGLPALLGNPYFEMDKFLLERIGPHSYKAPRADCRQDFRIDEALVHEFARLQAVQWDFCNPAGREKIWGLFGDRDTLAHYEPLFLAHYVHSFHFPGGHTPTAEEAKRWYVPLIRRMLDMNFRHDVQ